MEYEKLGSSELNVSRLALGCMSLKPGNEFNETILLDAVDLGINYFDTADLYDQGNNESLLGKILQPYRKDLIIATKVGNQLKADGGWEWNPTKAYILQAVEQGLRRLQTDYIDLYQLHGGTIDDPTDETIEAFELLKTQGKIRAYGISSIRPNVIRRWIDRSHMSSLMIQYSLLDRRPEEEVLPLVKEHNIGVVVRGSVAQGLLAGKEAKPYLGLTADEVEDANKMMKEIAGRKLSQMALQYVLEEPAVTSVVIGVSKPSQLEEALEVFELPPLGDMRKKLDEHIRALRYTEHR